MKRVLTLVYFSIIILTNLVAGQENTSNIEITKTDITLYPNLKSDKISVFGIRIGMTQNDVIQKLKNHDSLYYYIDKNHTTTDYRIYVYDKYENGEKKNCILYLIWSNNEVNLTEIIFYQDFTTYLIGSTTRLMTFEPFDPHSKLSQEYLGYPNKTEVTLDIPLINYKQTTYYYFSKGITIIFNEDDKGKKANFTFIKTN